MSSFALNNVTAPDAYSAEATLENLPELEHINLDVVNGAIYWSLKQSSNLTSDVTGTWQPEVFMLPGSRSLRRQAVVGIRVRAAIPAASLPAGSTQAQVTVEAVEA